MWALATAAAAELDVRCVPGGEDELLVAGLPPLEIRCTAAFPDGTFATGTTWRFGDGSTGSGPAVAHTYDEVGRYVLSATVVEPAESGDTGGPVDWSRQGEVAVCGPPTPRFTLRFRGGLRYLADNTTPPDPGCLSELRWDVFAGEGQQGDPLITTSTWSPSLVLPEEGVYTVVLSVGGIGGVAAVAATVDARGGRTDLFHEIGLPCSTGPAAPPLAALVALAALRRRRA